MCGVRPPMEGAVDGGEGVGGEPGLPGRRWMGAGCDTGGAIEVCRQRRGSEHHRAPAAATKRGHNLTERVCSLVVLFYELSGARSAKGPTMP